MVEMADNVSGGSALKPVSQLSTAADLRRKMDSLRTGRQRQERQWKLNLAFLRGNQYSYWNPSAKRIESLPTEDGEKPRYRVRIVSNQISIGVQSVVSKMIKTKPIWGATPGQVGDKAVKAAQFAEDLLEDWWRKLGMSDKYEEAVTWSQLADNGYLKASWDPYAATEMRFLMDPHGQPVTDPGVAEEYKSQLEVQNIDPKTMEKVAYMGDLKVESMSPFDVYLDPNAKSVPDAKWVICAHHLEPDEIEIRWPTAKKLKIVPDKVAAAPDEALPSQGSQLGGGERTLKTVYIGYFKKTPQIPNGRYVAFIENPDTILEDEKWPYPINELPIVQIRGIRIPGGTINDSVTTHALPIQKQINRLLSQITEYTNMVIKPRVWAPVNSLRQRLTTEPGAVYEYTPVGNHKPEIEQLPSIPPYVFQFLGELSGRLKEVFGLTEVTEGQLPPNLEAADAIDLLQEMATDRFAPAIIANENALARLGQFMLALAQEYYTEPRLLTVRGLGGMSSLKSFVAADFAGDLTVHVEAGSSMPRTRAARRKQVEKFVEMGLIKPESMWKYYDIADVKDLAVQFARDEDAALRENDKMLVGTPLNPEEVQKTMAAVNQGMNPETGQPLGPNDDPQSLLMKASVTPRISDNMTVHMDKHKDTINAPEFDSFSSEVRQRFLMHYELTLQMFRSMPQLPEAQPVHTTLQLKGSVGATTAAEILQRSGVLDADPQVIAQEAPLETLVTDSADKPDADANGPGREANDLSAAAKTMVEANVANASAQQTLAHTTDKHHVSTALDAQKARHAEELHAVHMRKANADASLAEKKAKQSDFKKTQTKPSPKKSKGHG